MLITFVDVISCENPECRDFARIIPNAHGVRTYYCPICGQISHARAIDTALVNKPQRYESYLREIYRAGKQALPV